MRTDIVPRGRNVGTHRQCGNIASALSSVVGRVDSVQGSRAGLPLCPPIAADIAGLRLWAKSGLTQCSKNLSFDHLIGKCE